MDSNNTVIGLVTNANDHAVLSAAAMLVMLGDRATTLPVVVFVAGAPSLLSAAQHRLLRSAGAQRVVPLKAMRIPDEFARVLNAGRTGRQVMFQRLGLWSHTEYGKIISLDSDMLVARNIDELALAPRDTFGPNICTYGCERRVSGFNSGVMVVGPSQPLFHEMAAYARRRAAGEAVGRAERLPMRRGRQRTAGYSGAPRSPLHELLVDQEQSFLAEFFADVHGIAIEADAPERAGYEWTWRSFSDSSLCGRVAAARTPAAPGPSQPCGGRVNIMSRLYNARPGDCDRCPSSYRPKLVHFACSGKPVNGRGGANASRRRWAAVQARCGKDSKVCSGCVAVSELRYLDAFARAEALWAAVEGT